ncbi:MAG: hypothetical protein HYR85_27250 [Planctomycetes bacterium]|nr:hypothetical protein [Planctomycetota bacterium]MBI3848351.1 hypothetical protein [Planctomycetota bacterium]
MRRIVAVLAASLAFGCAHVDVDVSTTVAGDGTVTRHLEAKHSNQEETAKAGGLLDVLLRPTAGFTRLSLTPARYVVDGRYAPCASIPCDLFWQPDAEGLHPGFRFRNFVSVDSRDLVLIQTHRYRETLSGAVVAPEYDLAVKQLLAFASDFVMRIADDVYGDDFDVEELRRFLDFEAAPELLRLAIAFYDFFAAHKPSRFAGGQEAWRERLIAITTESVRTLGLDVDFHADDAALRDAFARWFDSRITPLFLPRRLDPKPVTFERIESDAGRIAEVGLRLLRARYDTDLDLEWRVATDFLPPGMAALVAAEAKLPFHFSADVALPGEVFRTNGVAVGGGLASFAFESTEIFPEGYEMLAESFVPDLGAQERLLGCVPIADRKRALAFVDQIERLSPGTQRAALLAIRTAPESGAIEALGALERQPGIDRREISALRGWLESVR